VKRKRRFCFGFGGILLPHDRGNGGKKVDTPSPQTLWLSQYYDKKFAPGILNPQAQRFIVDVTGPLTREQLVKKLDQMKHQTLKMFDKLDADETKREKWEKARKKDEA
jgi:hypothetical protein